MSECGCFVWRRLRCSCSAKTDLVLSAELVNFAFWRPLGVGGLTMMGQESAAKSSDEEAEEPLISSGLIMGHAADDEVVVFKQDEPSPELHIDVDDDDNDSDDEVLLSGQPTPIGGNGNGNGDE